MAELADAQRLKSKWIFLYINPKYIDNTKVEILVILKIQSNI